jgi:hypothetical protein
MRVEFQKAKKALERELDFSSIQRDGNGLWVCAMNKTGPGPFPVARFLFSRIEPSGFTT